MFKGLARPRSGDGVQPEEDDDAISLTSTVEGPDDAEYGVEDILAERSLDDRTWYLMKWEGFPMEDCTWEPEENLGDELIATWEEKKQAGKVDPSKAEEFDRLSELKQRAKRERHRRRNAKRQRLGLPLTHPLPGSRADRSAYSEDEDEAEEVGLSETFSELTATEPSKRQKLTEALPKLTTSPGKSSPKASSPIEPKSKGKGKAQSSGSISKTPSSRPSKVSAAEAHGRAGPSTSKAQGERPSSTAYQGTARKLSASGGISKPVGSTSGGVADGKRKAIKSKANATGNIFAGGKTRKRRSTLEEKMSDKVTEPKLFRNMSMARKAELRGRSKEDLAPNPDSLVLFDLSKERPSKKASKSGSNDVSPISPGAQPFSPGVRQVVSEPMELETVSEAPPKRPSKSVSEPRPALKSRSSIGSTSTQPKRVRFLSPIGGEESLFVEEPQPMDLDDSATDHQRPRLHSPPPASEDLTPQLLSDGFATRRKMSLSDYARSKPTQSSEKNVVVGTRPAMRAVFHGLPGEQLDMPWLSAFLSEPRLEFHRTCLAQTAGGQLEALIETRLASGTIEALAGEPHLEQVADFLRAGLIGLFCPRPSYNVLVYPSKCDEWNLEVLRQETTVSSDAPLRYIMFTSRIDCTAVLPSPSASSTRIADVISDKTIPKRALVMKQFFGLDFAQLLPHKSNPSAPNVFFVAFPARKVIMGSALCDWLRACDENCQVFVSDMPGGWSAFQDASRSTAAVVIVHESLINSLRRFPALSSRLTLRLDRFWCFVEPSRPRPQYPSDLDSDLPPGNLQMVELFPDRTAVLLTPSFLVAESRRTLEILNWFQRGIEKRGYRYKLVMAYDIHKYLLSIASEKAIARDVLRQKQKTSVLADSTANLSGLSENDCKDAYDAATMALNMDMQRSKLAGPHDADEDNSFIMYAPVWIDPSDEQSLVNWFGWWSLTRADQFRKFLVVGSSESAKFNKRGEMLIETPHYAKTTINNPDIVLETVEQSLQEPEANAQAHLGPSEPQNAAGRQTMQAPHLPHAFKSTLALSETNLGIVKAIAPAMHEKSMHCTVYKFPVAWEDFTMADHYGDVRQADSRQNFNRIKEWFLFTCPFWRWPNGGSSLYYHTYLGFFYTPTDEWDPDNRPTPTRQRHPWLTVYRVYGGDEFGRKADDLEIIIWDPAANDKYRGSGPIELKDLMYMQRRVIQYIIEKTGTVNQGSTIRKVWIGGQSHEGDLPASLFDRTALHLVRIAREPETFLPHFGLERFGYREVVEKKSPSDDEDVPMDLDSSDAELGSEDETTRIIFHPPRGFKLSSGHKTNCKNRLYEEARLARLARKKTMTYNFPPTIEWYKEQEAEGRDFKHITVDQWPTVFSLLGLGAQKRANDPTSERRDSTASG